MHRFLCLTLVTSAALFAADSSDKPPLRTLSVTGDAEVKATPDLYTATIRLEGRHKDQATAREQVDSVAQKAIASAKALGIADKDIRTLFFQTRRVYAKESRTNVKSYEVNSRMSFTLRDVTKAEELVNGLTEAGASSVDGSDFSFSNPRKAADDARHDAVLAARQKAEAAADLLGVKLGAPLRVEILANDNAYGQRPNYAVNSVAVSSRETVAASVSDPIILPGEVTVRAGVRIEFELIKP